MGFLHRAFVAAGVGVGMSVIAGCGAGGGGWLSGSQSSGLSEQLNHVTAALDSGQCAQAKQYMADFRSRVNGLGGVDSTLVANLDQGASTIQTLIDRSCVVATPPAPKRTHPKTTTAPRTPPTTATFTTPSTPTLTQPSVTQPTTSTPSTTSTTGGVCPTCGVTTASTPSTTTPSGGTGLGGSVASTTPGATAPTTPPGGASTGGAVGTSGTGGL